MPVITVDAVTKEPRVFQGRKQWGVKLPNGEWLSMECDFQPQRGQSFDVAIKETSKNGKTYKNATIVGPAPTAPVPPPPPTPQASVEAQFNAIAGKPSQASNKIPWSDWTLVIQATWETAMLANMPPPEAVALVNTTLIAYSNGKLETPPEPPLFAADALVDPSLKSEIKEDDIPW